MAAQGAFIVIEGDDSALAELQYTMLAERLRNDGHQVASLAFPRLQHDAGYFARQYQDGMYGDQSHIGPYSSSLLFALDRFDAAGTIRGALAEGVIVLAHHFNGATMVEQGVKFKDSGERQGFYVWLDNLEFEVMGLPRPTLNVVLQSPSGGSTSVLYHELCQLFPKDFVGVDVTRGGEPLKDSDLGTILLEKIRPYLPAITAAQLTAGTAEDQPSAIQQHRPYAQRHAEAANDDTTASLSTPRLPAGFDPATAKAYAQAMDEALAKRDQLQSGLMSAGVAANDAEAIARLTTPAGSDSRLIQIPAVSPDETISGIAHQYLPNEHTVSQPPLLSLAQVSPRNELDIVANVLYSYSDSAFRQLSHVSASWPYERKARILQAYYARPTAGSAALEAMSYTWEIFSSLGARQIITEIAGSAAVQQQAVSPRYGYEVPEAVDQAGLADDYMDSFDASLQLYSRLQKDGYTSQAQLAVLAGHRLRWTLHLNGLQLRHMLQSASSADSEQLAGTAHAEAAGVLDLMRDKLSETHPLLAASLTNQ